MIRSAAGKVLWVGRATVFMVGLAVILALVFGAATTAMGADGKPFLLGKRNVATLASKLINRGEGPALSLKVGEGQPPLAVNSSARVANLNADQLDGLDSTQLPRDFYRVSDILNLASPENGFAGGEVFCDEGDQVVGGGYGDLHPTSHIATDSPTRESTGSPGPGPPEPGSTETKSGWVITWRTADSNTTDDVRVDALCADFGDTHQEANGN